MRDIFYNTNDVGSEDWKSKLNEGELTEWNWICNNKQEIEKWRSKVGLKYGWYLGRLIYVLSFKGGSDESGDYDKDEYAQKYARFEDDIVIAEHLESEITLYKKICKLYNLLLDDKDILPDLGITEEYIDLRISQYQAVLDEVKMDSDNIPIPERYNYKTALNRRVEFLYWQMEVEKIDPKDSIEYIYKLYNEYKFDDYYDVTYDDLNYTHPLFRRIEKQRNRALQHFKHRKIIQVLP